MTTARHPRSSALGALLVAGGAVATARAVSLLLAAVQIPLVARLLPADEYATVPASIQLATLVGLLVADPAVLSFQRHPGTSSDRRDYRWAVRWTALGLAVGIAVLLAGGALTGLLALATGVTGWMLGITVNRLAAVAWLTWGHEWRYTTALLTSTAARTAVLVGVLAAGLSAPIALALAGAVSAVLALALAPRGHGVVARGATLGVPSSPTGRHHPTLRLGAGLTIGQLGLQVQTVAPLLVATALLGTASTGALGAATQVAGVLAATLNLVTTLAYPRLRRRWDSGGAASVLTVARLLVGCCLALGAWAVAALTLGDLALLRQVLPVELVDGRLVVATAAAACLSSIGLVASWTHQFTLHTALIVRRSLVAGAATVGLVVGGTLLAGVHGAALGAVVGLALYATVMLVGSGLAGADAPLAVIALTAAALAVVIVGDRSWTLVAALATALALTATATYGRRALALRGLSAPAGGAR